MTVSGNVTKKGGTWAIDIVKGTGGTQSVSGKTLTLTGLNLVKPGDTATATFSVANNGTVNASASQVKLCLGSASNCSTNISSGKITVADTTNKVSCDLALTSGTLSLANIALAAKNGSTVASKEFNITCTFDSSVTSIPSTDTSLLLTAEFNYQQA